MSEFVNPAFLDNQTSDEIMERMVENLPDDIDVSEGSHPYNLLMPTAAEKDYFVNFILTEAIKLIFPQFCEGYDEIVDFHAETCGLVRKSPFYATGEVTVTGAPGTTIPIGVVVSTASVNEAPSLDFEVYEGAVIGEDGTCKVKIRAEDPGPSGNVAQGTILFSDGSVDGIDSVINDAATSGGVEGESTESLINRIVEYEKNHEISFTGCVSDYKRWAESVSGTGAATVIPANDDSGLVTIVLTDSLGAPATPSLCKSVYDFIMRPDSPEDRIAPINAKLEVVAPLTIPLTIIATVILENNVTLSMAKDAFVKELTAYIGKLQSGEAIRYTKIANALGDAAGIYDYSGLTVNGGTENIEIDTNEFPSVSADTITLVEA